MSSPYSHSDIFPFIVSIKCTYLLALILYLCCILFFKHPLKWFHKFLFCRYTSEVAVSSVYRQFTLRWCVYHIYFPLDNNWNNSFISFSISSVSELKDTLSLKNRLSMDDFLCISTVSYCFTLYWLSSNTIFSD